MKSLLTDIARRLWPDFDSLTEQDRLALLKELFGTFYGLPFVAIGLIWLIAATDMALLREWWPLLLLILGLAVLAGRLSFFQVSITRDGQNNYNGSSLEIVIVMSAMLLFGPTAVWVPFWGRLIDYTIDRPQRPTRFQQWNRFRNLVFNIGPAIVGLLLALLLYQAVGGQFPLAELTLSTAWPAFALVLASMPIEGLFILSYAFLLAHFQLIPRLRQDDQRGYSKQMFTFFLLAAAPAFFGILAAVIFTQLGLFAYLYFIAGVLLASLLARRLSQQAMLSQQRSREVTQLEQLGRAILAAPVDASTLPQLLANYVPKMFGYHHVEIKLFTGSTLLHLPAERSPVKQENWEWLQANPHSLHIAPGDTAPWSADAAAFPLYLNPILSTEEANPLGGICLTLEPLYYEISAVDLGPALKVLAAQIATALHQADVQEQMLAHQKTVQELDFAWQIQESFLPITLPWIEGWQLAATLKPCRETSGDFYDVLSLPNGRLGFLVADVADKGMGAALYMALSRTLIRTYAFEHQTRPDLVLQATNQRILTDTRNDMFVTAFYGILDPVSGELVYANAGHNPPYLFKDHAADQPPDLIKARGLRNTGMPLGILAEAEWTAESAQLDLGDTLLMYTDGVTEAQNSEHDFFGDLGLITVVQENLTAPALTIQNAVTAAVAQFSAGEETGDDQTLLIIKWQ